MATVGLAALGLAVTVLGHTELPPALFGVAGISPRELLAFVLAGASLWFLQSELPSLPRRLLGQASALGVTLLALLTLGEQMYGWGDIVRTLLVRHAGAAGAALSTSHMGSLSLANFLLLGFGLLFLDLETHEGNCPGQLPTILAVLGSLLGVLGVGWGDAASHPSAWAMEALLFVLLSMGVLLARPDRGIMLVLASENLGGVTARRLLPTVIVLTLALAWARWEGERAGYYGSRVGVALFAISSIAILAALIWWTARSLDLADQQRQYTDRVVRQAYDELETRVVERTADLERANDILRNEIEERQKAEKALSYFAAIVQSSDDAIIGKTLDGVIVSWNVGAERLYGYAAEETIGRQVSTLFPPDHQDELEEIMGKLRRGERIDHYETERQRKDGRRIRISLTLSPVRDNEGRVIGASSIARDISERERAREALEQANSVLTGWLQELEKRALETTLLNEMNDLLLTCIAPEEAYAVIARFAHRLFPNEAGALSVLNTSKSLIETMAVWGEAPLGERVFLPEDCWALRRGQVHLVERPSEGLVCQHLGPRREISYLCVPMMAQGETLGVLHLQAVAGGQAEARLPETKQRLAITVAGHIALALANLRLRETLRMQSIRDPLTGLFNRRYMEESLARELRRAARNQRRLGAILFDLDHFKRYNDTFGHEAGDALLRELGHFLKTRTRREDIACRYGGDEFVLILPEAGLEITRQRAERLREEFKRLTIQHRAEALGPVTLSLGVAVFPEHGPNAEDILRVADRALYRAKAEGRDHVAVGESLE